MRRCDAKSLQIAHEQRVSGAISDQTLRDTARCLVTETTFGVEVHTLDRRVGDTKRQTRSRHSGCDVNYLEKTVLKGPYTEIFMDWYWWIDAYVRDRLRDSFFNDTIPKLLDTLTPTGSIFLPLTPTILVRSMTAPCSKYTLLHVLTEEEMTNQASLFNSTISIQHEYDLMKKEPYQHKRLGVTLPLVRSECEVLGLPRSEVKRIWNSYETISGDEKPIFIKLTKL
jgi:hypothetical protein